MRQGFIGPRICFFVTESLRNEGLFAITFPFFHCGEIAFVLLATGSKECRSTIAACTFHRFPAIQNRNLFTHFVLPLFMVDFVECYSE